MNPDHDNRKQQVVSVFNSVAEGYDNPSMRFFSFAADELVNKLKPAAGERILDIATGTGAVATASAKAVSPSGHVIAVDLSEAMLKQATQKAKRQGLGNIDFVNMDAEDLKFKNDYFHHATCSFGLFFLPDMARALKEWMRVIKPGGSLLFSSFTENAFNPMMEKFVTELEQFGVQFEESPITAQRLSKSSQCLEIMTSAGLENRIVESHQLGYYLQHIEEWWTIITYSGLSGLLDKLAPQHLASFKAQHLEGIQTLVDENGLWLDVEVLISHGKVPAS